MVISIRVKIEASAQEEERNQLFVQSHMRTQDASLITVARGIFAFGVLLIPIGTQSAEIRSIREFLNRWSTSEH
jgi:hypothetical protein